MLLKKPVYCRCIHPVYPQGFICCYKCLYKCRCMHPVHPQAEEVGAEVGEEEEEVAAGCLEVTVLDASGLAAVLASMTRSVLKQRNQTFLVHSQTNQTLVWFRTA